MRKLLFFSLIVCAALAVSLGCVLINSDDPLFEKALVAFLEKDFPLSQEILSTIENQKETLAPKAYLAAAQEDFADSTYLFQRALTTFQSEKNLQEIFLCCALNAFFMNEPQEMEDFLEKALYILPKEGSSPVLYLTEALVHYINCEFVEAANFFTAYQNSSPQTKGWLEALVSHHFSPLALEMRYALALTEQNKVPESAAIGRELLEKMVQNSTLIPEERGRAALFLAMIYLKESADLPFPEKSSHFKVALSYLKKGKIESLFPYEKKFLQNSLFQGAYSLVALREISPLLFEAITLLEKWESIASLEKLAEGLVDMICSQTEPFHSSQMALCTTLKERFGQNLSGASMGAIPKTFHSILLDKFYAVCERQLKSRDLLNPHEMWQKLEALTPSISPQFVQTIAELTEKEILQLLHEEKEPLKKSLSYLKFWKNIENSERRNHFATALFSNGIYYWKKENCEHKGSSILKLALYLADEPLKKDFFKDLELFFVALYQSARGSNMINRLPLIYDAFEDFAICMPCPLTEDELVNHLADAEYLLSVQNYCSARMHAEWVVKVDPQNRFGLKLLGMTAFHLGDFLAAKESLSKISDPDSEVLQALALSEVFYPGEEEETLVRVDALDALDIVHALEASIE